MGKFLLRRLITSIPLMFAITIIVFLMVQMVPGDPVMLMLGPESMMTGDDIEKIREQLGFNDPLYVQYLNYMKKLMRGELGNSVRSKSPVFYEIKIRIPNTIELAVASMAFAITMGVALGISSALNHNSIYDNMSSAISLLGVSLPSFWLALLLIWVFAIQLRWFPVTSGPATGLKGLVLPAITLGLAAQTAIARLVRAGMLEVMMNDYIRTARSKGMQERVVIIRHALRNSLIPVVTVVGVQLGSILAGTTIIETVFGRLGIGNLLVNSILIKDMPVVQAILLLVAGIYFVINIMVEAGYVWLDPRIRLN